jgi:hypothetical protein
MICGMKRTFAILLATALGLTACLARSQPTPTATPQPLFTATAAGAAATATLAAPATAAASDTAAPTVAPSSTTALASDTPAPVAATATPAASPTPDPNEAVGDVVYQDKLDGKGGWFWTFSDDVANFGVVNGKLKGVMKAANSGWRFTISPDTVQLGSQQVSLTAHSVSCGPNDEYGLMLRVKPDASNSGFDGYLFRLRCSGAASFDLVTGIKLTTIVDWTASPAIKAGAPADNTLLIWAAAGDFRFYVNDQYLFSAQDSTLTAGFYGIYVYDRTAGGETVNFDTLVAKAVKK